MHEPPLTVQMEVTAGVVGTVGGAGHTLRGSYYLFHLRIEPMILLLLLFFRRKKQVTLNPCNQEIHIHM